MASELQKVRQKANMFLTIKRVYFSLSFNYFDEQDKHSLAKVIFFVKNSTLFGKVILFFSTFVNDNFN